MLNYHLLLQLILNYDLVNGISLLDARKCSLIEVGYVLLLWHISTCLLDWSACFGYDCLFCIALRRVQDVSVCPLATRLIFLYLGRISIFQRCSSQNTCRLDMGFLYLHLRTCSCWNVVCYVFLVLSADVSAVARSIFCIPGFS